jgi:hypothetical protein
VNGDSDTETEKDLEESFRTLTEGTITFALWERESSGKVQDSKI